jgi:hypothetical protein
MEQIKSSGILDMAADSTQKWERESFLMGVSIIAGEASEILFIIPDIENIAYWDPSDEKIERIIDAINEALFQGQTLLSHLNPDEGMVIKLNQPIIDQFIKEIKYMIDNIQRMNILIMAIKQNASRARYERNQNKQRRYREALVNVLEKMIHQTRHLYNISNEIYRMMERTFLETNMIKQASSHKNNDEENNMLGGYRKRRKRTHRKQTRRKQTHRKRTHRKSV